MSELCPSFDSAKSADSVENKVESLAQETGYVEEAEGANTCGNESPESINCDKLDGALRQTSTQHSNTFSYFHVNSDLVSYLKNL